jgi:hypothetical protein
MKKRVLNLLLILTSLFGYLEWGSTNNSFLFQAEAELLVHLFNDFASAVHPFTLIPLGGQVILAITLFQREPGKLLTYVGIACIGLLLIFMLFIGIFNLNIKITASVLPFWIVAVIAIRTHRASEGVANA